MPRHNISALSPDLHQVVVGWDSPLRTFFAEVHDKTVPKDSSESDLVLSLGNNYDEIKGVEELQTKLKEYAILSDEMVAVLNQEKTDALVNHCPSLLQQQMEQLMKSISVLAQSSTTTIEVVKCQIDWYLTWSNSPSLIVWVKKLPDFSKMPHQKFLIGKKKDGEQEYDSFLYYAEVDGFVHKLHGNTTVNESGYGGATFGVLLQDGTVDAVKGPWDSAWIEGSPVPPYYSITVIEEGQNGRSSCYLTESKYKALVEQYCPEAEVVSVPGRGRLRIKRKGYALNFPSEGNHGAIPHSEEEYRGFTIKVFYVPETNQAIAEVWEPDKTHRSRSTDVCSSPSLALTAAWKKADKLIPRNVIISLDEEEDEDDCPF